MSVGDVSHKPLCWETFEQRRTLQTEEHSVPRCRVGQCGPDAGVDTRQDGSQGPTEVGPKRP